MIRTLQIDGFRGFRKFSMEGLGRVNLLVGTNNCGKTTALEAAHILASIGDVGSLWASQWRRGEDLWEERDRDRFVEVRRLFHGHEIEIGSSFQITGMFGFGPISFMAGVIEQPTSKDESLSQPQLFESDLRDAEAETPIQPAAIAFEWKGSKSYRTIIPITRRGGMSADYPRSARSPEGERGFARFITAAALSPTAITSLFEEIVLTPEEELVVDALKIIEPSIERIAPSGMERSRNSPYRVGTKGGMLVRCTGVKSRIPIGSMGDGLWRMLGLALALVRADGGILFIDEIDTGLHFTVMADMWKLVYKTAKRLNVQVFATTHSRDCTESLAVICRQEVSDESDITIQRIERGRERSVAYSEQEIIAAAKRGMEVR